MAPGAIQMSVGSANPTEIGLNTAYNNGYAPATLIHARNGLVHSDPFELRVPAEYDQLSTDILYNRLDIMNRSPRLLRSGPYQYEVVEATDFTNAAARLSLATVTSGATNNNGPGNMFEFALRAELRQRPSEPAKPPLRELYVSSPGNGQSTALTPQELSAFSKMRRLYTLESDGSITPFPYITHLARALRWADMQVEALDADSSGTVVATALAIAIGNNQIRQLFQNDRPQMVGLRPTQIAKAMLKENNLGTRRNSHTSEDFWAVDNNAKGMARVALSSLFVGPPRASVSGIELVKWGHDLHREKPGIDTLTNDMIRLAQANQAIDITTVTATSDSFLGRYAKPGEQSGRWLQKRAESISRKTSTIGAVGVRHFLIPGNHSWHTYYPALRHALQSSE